MIPNERTVKKRNKKKNIPVFWGGIAETNLEEKGNDDKCYNELHYIIHSLYHTAFP